MGAIALVTLTNVYLPLVSGARVLTLPGHSTVHARLVTEETYAELLSTSANLKIVPVTLTETVNHFQGVLNVYVWKVILALTVKKKSMNANTSRAKIMEHVSEKWTRIISVNASVVLAVKIVLKM